MNTAPSRDLAAEFASDVDGFASADLAFAEDNARVKPRLRGYSHLFASVAALAGTSWLLHVARTERASWAALIYGVSLTTMFTISGLYHAPYWASGIREWWRRLDHAAVFLLTGGCYTVWCLLAMPEDQGSLLFKVIWGLCAVGVLRALLWPRAPRWVIAGLYVVIGWTIIPWLGVVYRTAGPGAVWWAFTGGVIYTLSAVVYAKKRPNPWPRWFGYHEVMHLIVLTGAGVHFHYIHHLVSSAR